MHGDTERQLLGKGRDLGTHPIALLNLPVVEHTFTTRGSKVSGFLPSNFTSFASLVLHTIGLTSSLLNLSITFP